MWFVNGLFLFMEWVWGVLDMVTMLWFIDDWFVSGLFCLLVLLVVGIMIVMMLMLVV